MRLFDLQQMLQNESIMQGYGFSPNQTVAIGGLFKSPTGSLMEELILDQALTDVGPHMLGLAATDGVEILKLSTNQNTRIDILKAIVNVTQDLVEQSKLYIAQFTGFLYQGAAKSIVDAATPFGCVFGNTTVVKRFAFVIDTSGSMATTFAGPSGPVSRIAFIQGQLEAQLKTIKPDQEFNIIRFSSEATQWQPGVVSPTVANVASASSFAAKLVAGGSTNMLAGMKLAMSDPKVVGIFLLTDGQPNGPTATIVDAVTKWSTSGTKKKPVFPTSFFAQGAGDWMKEMAEVSGGIFRKIES
jgi:hypothetical protein